MPETIRSGILPRRNIGRIGPTTAVPTPMTNVARSTSSAPGATARRIPATTITATLSATPPRVPNAAATVGPARANRPMHRTGIVVSRPTKA